MHTLKNIFEKSSEIVTRWKICSKHLILNYSQYENIYQKSKDTQRQAVKELQDLFPWRNTFDLNSASTDQNNRISEVSSRRPESSAVHYGGFFGGG